MQTTAPVTEQFGHLKVITWKDAEIISINVFTSGTRNSTLSAAYPHTDREGAKAWYRTVRDAGLAGRPVWQIEAMLSALIDAAQVVDQAERDMVAGIRANIEAAQPTPVDVTDIVGDGHGWNRFKQATTRKAAATTEPMDRVLGSAVDGYIPRSKDATSVQLIALHVRGLVELDYRWSGKTRRIVGAWLAGRKPAEVA